MVLRATAAVAVRHRRDRHRGARRSAVPARGRGVDARRWWRASIRSRGRRSRWAATAVAVTNLTPAGAEPHDLELNPDQIDEVLDAKVVFDLGQGFQPAVEQAAEQRDGPTVQLLAARHEGPARLARSRAHGRRSCAPCNASSPRRIRRAVPCTRATPTACSASSTRSTRGTATGSRTASATSSSPAHEAFGHLAKRYGLRQEGVAGLSPDAEPDAKRIAQLTDLVKRLGVTTVFTEELVSPRIADTLAREAGVNTETLNPLEGLTDRELHARRRLRERHGHQPRQAAGRARLFVRVGKRSRRLRQDAARAAVRARESMGTFAGMLASGLALRPSRASVLGAHPRRADPARRDRRGAHALAAPSPRLGWWVCGIVVVAGIATQLAISSGSRSRTTCARPISCASTRASARTSVRGSCSCSSRCSGVMLIDRAMRRRRAARPEGRDLSADRRRRAARALSIVFAAVSRVLGVPDRCTRVEGRVALDPGEDRQGSVASTKAARRRRRRRGRDRRARPRH